MQRYVSILLSIFLIITALAGCSETATTTAAPNPPPATSTTADNPAKTTESTTPSTNEEPLVKKPDDYPGKTIEYIVPAAAGAIIDVPSRALADSLDLGQPIVVINMAGASQTIGTAEAKNKPADGYTLLTAANAGMLLQPHLVDLTYSLDDFRHISMLLSPDPMAVVVTPSSRIKSFADLEKALKEGEDLTYTFSNPGGIGHLAMLSVMEQMNTKAEFVPFNGSAEGITALLGGHIDFLVVDASECAKREKDNQFNTILILDEERSFNFPNVPAAGELGYKGMGAFLGFKWIAVHKETPDEIVKWLKQEIDAATQTPQYQEFVKNSCTAPLRVYTEEEITKILKDSSEACKAQFEKLGMAKK
jgi:tripartite-type tricarboxylate transporter receptor subunit TctC